MKSQSVTCLLGMVILGFMAGNAVAETVHLAANFDDQPLDQPIGTNGPEYGQPVWVDPDITAIVRDYPLPTANLEIQDIDDYSAGYVRFEFLGSVELTSGFVTMSMNLWFHELSPGYSFQIGFREQGASAYNFCNLNFVEWGEVYCYDQDTNNGMVGTFEVGRAFPIIVSFDMDAGHYSVWLDGELAVDNEPHGVVGRGVGALICGCMNDPDVESHFNIDDILVTDQEIVTAAENPATDSVLTRLYPCYPNPCNPRTKIKFYLPGISAVDLSLFDLRGRRVNALVNDILSRGHHEFVWNGCDDQGRALPSGVYRYRLTNGFITETRSVLLVR